MDFYHATLINLDGQPFFARGAIPTIHASLTYTAWYGCWLASMSSNPRDFMIYRLRGVDNYLEAHVEGGFYVRDVGSFSEDKRDLAILEDAPELFHKGWEWSGELTYIPAEHLQRLSLEEVQQGIKPEQWRYLSVNSNVRLQFFGRPSFAVNGTNHTSRLGKLAFMEDVPNFLRPKVAKG